MDKQELEKLNERMLKFAGYKHYDSNLWLNPSNQVVLTEHSSEPPVWFTQDLTACFHLGWGIVRKLSCVRIEYASGWSHIYLEKGSNSTEFVGEVEPALALCLAIEKLIDGEST